MNEQSNFINLKSHLLTPSIDYRLRVKKMHPDAILPTKANTGDLGYDLYALEDTVVNPGVVTKVRTGIQCNWPSGFGALIRDRSSVATKTQIFVVAGVIDNGYTGEVIVAFFNPGHLEVTLGYDFNDTTDLPTIRGVDLHGPELIKKGQKIAQMLLYPAYNVNVVEVDELTTTQRGDNGFGSSGT